MNGVSIVCSDAEHTNRIVSDASSNITKVELVNNVCDVNYGSNPEHTPLPCEADCLNGDVSDTELVNSDVGNVKCVPGPKHTPLHCQADFVNSDVSDAELVNIDVNSVRLVGNSISDVKLLNNNVCVVNYVPSPEHTPPLCEAVCVNRDVSDNGHVNCDGSDVNYVPSHEHICLLCNAACVNSNVNDVELVANDVSDVNVVDWRVNDVELVNSNASVATSVPSPEHIHVHCQSVFEPAVGEIKYLGAQTQDQRRNGLQETVDNDIIKEAELLGEECLQCEEEETYIMSTEVSMKTSCTESIPGNDNLATETRDRKDEKAEFEEHGKTLSVEKENFSKDNVLTDIPVLSDCGIEQEIFCNQNPLVSHDFSSEVSQLVKSGNDGIDCAVHGLAETQALSLQSSCCTSSIEDIHRTRQVCLAVGSSRVEHDSAVSEVVFNNVSIREEIGCQSHFEHCNSCTEQTGMTASTSYAVNLLDENWNRRNNTSGESLYSENGGSVVEASFVPSLSHYDYCNSCTTCSSLIQNIEYPVNLFSGDWTFHQNVCLAGENRHKTNMGNCCAICRREELETFLVVDQTWTVPVAVLEDRKVEITGLKQEDRHQPVTGGTYSSRSSKKRKKQKLKLNMASVNQKQKKAAKFAHTFTELIQKRPWLEDVNPNIDHSLSCPVCLDLYHRPHVCHPCEHIFCEPCLRKMTGKSSEGIPCPLCRVVIGTCVYDKDLDVQMISAYPETYQSRVNIEKYNKCQRNPLPFTPPEPLSSKLLHHLISSRHYHDMDMIPRIGVNFTFLKRLLLLLLISIVITVFLLDRLGLSDRIEAESEEATQSNQSVVTLVLWGVILYVLNIFIPGHFQLPPR